MTTHATQPFTRDALDAGTDTVHRLSRVERAVELSYETSAVDAVDYGRQCVAVARSQPERQRRRLVARRRDIINDNWQALVYSDLKDRLHSDLHRAVLGKDGQFCDISRNPAKNIWQETAVLYKGPAQRETPSKPNDAELYKDLTRDTKFQTFWQRVEFELMVFNDLILWPSTIKRHGRKVLKHNKAAGDTVTAIFEPELGGRNEPYALVFIDNYRDAAGNNRERYFVVDSALARSV
jgi:hypothetical protein